MKLSITSVMLPRWDLQQTFDKLAGYGYEALELRVRDNPEEGAEPSFWGRHLADVSPANLLDRVDEIRAHAERTGIRVVAFAPRATIDDDELLDVLFEGARRIDPETPPMIRVGAPRHDRTQPYFPQFETARAGYERVTAKAARAGVKVLYEIHVGTVAVSCSRTAQLLDGLDPAHIGAIYDVPNMVRVGLEDTRMGMELLGPYLAHVHIGNGVPVADRQEPEGPTAAQIYRWVFSDLRRGVADIAQIVQDLKDVGYDGAVSLEEFGPGDDDDKVSGQGAYLKHLMGG